MSDLIYNCFLSEREFLVLAALTGLEKITVPSKKFFREFEEEELNYTLFELYRKEILDYKGENRYELRHAIRTIFEGIKGADRELRIFSPNLPAPMLCFLGETAVILESSENQESTVRIHMLPGKDFAAELSEREILPAEIPDFLEETEISDAGTAQRIRMRLMPEGRILFSELEKFMEERQDLSVLVTITDRKKEQDLGIGLILDGGMQLVQIGQGRALAESYREKDLEDFLFYNCE